MTFILKTEGLNKTYRLGGIVNAKQIQALNDVNITVESDKPVVIAIVGESGSGKTTLAKTLLRLETPTSGRAIVYDEVVAGQGAIPNKKDFLGLVQPIFQNPFEAFNPLKRLDRYLFMTGRHFAGAADAAAEQAQAERALRQVGLSLAEARGRFPHELSGGQLQRVAVARALIASPSLLVADEPVSMVDASLRTSIVNLFRTLRDELGVSILYITHDLATAYSISDRVVILRRGQVVESGDARQVLDHPQHPYSMELKGAVLAPEVSESGSHT